MYSRTTLLIVAVVLVGRAPTLAAQQPLAGTWRGYWTKANDTLTISLTVRADSATGRYRASFGSEQLRVSGIPFADVQMTACCKVTMTLRGDRTTTVFTGTLSGDSLTGVLKEGADEGRFAYSRVGPVASSAREQEIAIRNGDVTLKGTLLLPPSGKPSLAVVFLHGSGAEPRSASRYLAERLVEHGIAALIYDKRGAGASTGDWRRATPDDLMSDGRSVVDALARVPELSGTRIGVYGHSQGGTLLPMLAAQSPHVRFVIASAAAGVPTDSMEIFSILNSVLPRAHSRSDSATAVQYVSLLVRTAYDGWPRARLDSLVEVVRGQSWFFAPPSSDDSYWSFSRTFGAYEPLSWWARVRVPTLLLYGDLDQRVQARESAARISATLLRAGNGNVTVHIFPDADHTFRLAAGPSGWPRSAPQYMRSLFEWLGRLHE